MLDFCVQFGWTALMKAAEFGHEDTVKALIAANADMNAVDIVSQPCRGLGVCHIQGGDAVPLCQVYRLLLYSRRAPTPLATPLSNDSATLLSNYSATPPEQPYLCLVTDFVSLVV